MHDDFGIAGIVSAGTAELLTKHDNLNSGQTDIMIDFFLHSRTARFLNQLHQLPLRQTDCWEWGQCRVEQFRSRFLKRKRKHAGIDYDDTRTLAVNSELRKATIHNSHTPGMTFAH